MSDNTGGAISPVTRVLSGRWMLVTTDALGAFPYIESITTGEKVTIKRRRAKEILEYTHVGDVRSERSSDGRFQRTYFATAKGAEFSATKNMKSPHNPMPK